MSCVSRRSKLWFVKEFGRFSSGLERVGRGRPSCEVGLGIQSGAVFSSYVIVYATMCRRGEEELSVGRG